MAYGRPMPLPRLAPIPQLGMQPVGRGATAISQRAPLPPSGPGGLAGLLAKPGISQALLAFGANMLAESDRPGGSLGGALGRSLPAGVQAFGQGQQEAEVEKLMASAPPEMQQLLRALPPQQRVPALMQMMQRPTPVAVGANERLVNPETGAAIVDVAPPPPDKPPADIQSFREFLAMSPEEQGAYMQFLEAKRPPGTTVNVGAAEGGVKKAIGDAAFKTIGDGATRAQAAIDKVGAIDRIIDITSNPKFAEVSGPIWGGKVGELSARFKDDPEARQLAAEFMAVGGQMTMAQLEAFTGPKTDFEFQQAKKLVFNDPNMTVEEIQAGLKMHRAVAVEEARRWANDMLDLDPQRLNFDPRDVSRQLGLAETITTTFGGSGAAPAAAADPLGLRRR